MTKPIVAFLGPQGTFTDEAARRIFHGKEVEFRPMDTIAEVLMTVDQGKTPYGIVPIENSIEGSVNMTLDWLIHEVDLTVIGELEYPIEQHLITLPDTASLEGIRHIYSHPHAVAQCRSFLKDHVPEAEIHFTVSTAEAIRLIQEEKRYDAAAIGPRLGAERYGLKIYSESIQDYENNYTRFIAVSRQPEDLLRGQEFKTTLLITPPTDYPGALHQVLSAFAWRKINLTRIESRPTKKKLGTYVFFIDIVMPKESILVEGAIGEIEAIGCQIKRLGCYPAIRVSRS
jgi:prephenate dehydratase